MARRPQALRRSREVAATRQRIAFLARCKVKPSRRETGFVTRRQSDCRSKKHSPFRRSFVPLGVEATYEQDYWTTLAMSGLPPTATKDRTSRHVSKVPEAEAISPIQIVSSARTRRDAETLVRGRPSLPGTSAVLSCRLGSAMQNPALIS